MKFRDLRDRAGFPLLRSPRGCWMLRSIDTVPGVPLWTYRTVARVVERVQEPWYLVGRAIHHAL